MSAQPLPVEEDPRRALPDYLPARMINEFVYCPRLFYYEQVEGIFVHNEHTEEGAAQHKRVDKEGGSAPKPGAAADEEPVVVRSITLSSEEHHVVAKLDLAEFADGWATPVDYKRGRPQTTDDGPRPWPADRVQLAVQALALRANGYRCSEGVLFYHKTRQRVRVTFDEAVIAEAEAAIVGAWATAAAETIPAPLEDSPKCAGCSLVGVCLPDESRLAQAGDGEEASQLELYLQARLPQAAEAEARLLVAPRVDLRPLYVNTHGLSIGKSGGVLRIKDRDKKVVQDVRINEVCQST